jgi:hypothetical protein
MAETKKSLIYLIYDDLVKAVKGIGSKTFLGRPEPVGLDVANFIVIDIPAEIRGRVKGNYDTMVGSHGTFSVFCKSKTDRTLNINSQSDITQKVLDVFPINGKYITASCPNVLMDGFDETGYHVTTISFKLRSKFNAREKQ